VTPTQEERLAALEQKVTDNSDRFNAHLVTCGQWQQSMFTKLDGIQTELQNRLPRWATIGGIVTFSMLTGALGYMAKVAGIG